MTQYNHSCRHHNITIKTVPVFRSCSLIIIEIAMRFYLNIEINQNHAMTDAVMWCTNYKYDIRMYVQTPEPFTNLHV